MLNFVKESNEVTQNRIRWITVHVEINFNHQDYLSAKDQSKRKSKCTMAASQAGQYRSDELKYQRQLMGILAEIAVKKYLESVLEEFGLHNDWAVIRYDDVRVDEFKSPVNEYDIRIVNQATGEFVSVECRSSTIRDRSFTNGLETLNIIGPYSSIAKAAENESDLYILPLYEFLNYKLERYLPSNFERNLIDGRLRLHLVAGCNNVMLQQKGGKSSLGQYGTVYRVLQILAALDIQKMSHEVVTQLQK
jgi:hypothetical protein